MFIKQHLNNEKLSITIYFDLSLSSSFVMTVLENQCIWFISNYLLSVIVRYCIFRSNLKNLFQTRFHPQIYFFFNPAFNRSSSPSSAFFFTFFLTIFVDTAMAAASSSCFFISCFLATLAAKATASDELRSAGFPD